MATQNPKRSVLFRADGNAQIGLGHVMRCLALAEMLGSDYNRRFAIVQPAPEVVKLIEEKEIEVVVLAAEEPGAFLSIIGASDVVVLDGYSFNTDFQRAVRLRAKALAFIDDLVTGHQVADVIINHAGGLTPNEYQAEAYTQFFLGPNYALLRPAFFIPSTPTPEEGPIFISLGGADPSNTSIKVLNSLRGCFKQANQEWRVHVVVGPMQQNRPAIEALQSQFKHLHLLSNLTADQMVAELTKCQLAITACSTVAYEVCSVGRPLIAVQTADNQINLAFFLMGKNLANVLLSALSINDIHRGFQIGTSVKFSEARQIMVDNQRRFFDGQSPERFRALFNRLTA